MKPVRIQLSRAKGFNLQAVSLALNGLPAINVARPSKHGNPFTIAFCRNWFGCGEAEARKQSVNLCDLWLRHELPGGWTDKKPPSLEAIKAEISGRNVACWCHAGQACHADLLLRIANE